MKNLFPFFVTSLILLSNKSFCPVENERNNYVYKNEINLIGSTPGDNFIKERLGISLDTKIDFIRWDLKIDKSNSFALNIKYGENQPNTLGFVRGGQYKDFKGICTISHHENNEIYHFKANQLNISMIQLNENLFHLLTQENKLLVGNGGWSYTLNNKYPIKNNVKLPSLSTTNNSINDRLIQVIYDGRTPCQEFAREHQMKVSQECFKLKWKLTLNRDSINFRPTTYSIRKVVDNMPRDITGMWTIVHGTATNPDAIVYQLDPDKPSQTISLLVGDENILFFLHKDKNLFIGNDDFSFTLNKRQDYLK